MGPDSLPYLFFPRGRGGLRYPTYRRDGLRRPLETENKERIKGKSRKALLADPRVVAAWLRIHNAFESEKKPDREKFVYEGSIAHAIDYWLKEELPGTILPQTIKGYNYIAQIIRRDHGHRPAATTPRDAISKILNDVRRVTPGQSDSYRTVLRGIFGYVYDHPVAFKLPENWSNPTIGGRRKKAKRNQKPTGWIPWEEWQIQQFRDYWPPHTRERVIFEVYLNTGQRGCDVAKMGRKNLAQPGQIAVVQQKTLEPIWLGLLDDLAEVLLPWLKTHDYEPFFPLTKKPKIGQPHGAASIKSILTKAISAAGLPDDLVPHGLRYTFATRAIELGLDHQNISSIVGHRSLQNAVRYTAKRRAERLVIATMNRGLAANRAHRRPAHPN